MKLLRWQHALISIVILFLLIALIITLVINPIKHQLRDTYEYLHTREDQLQRYSNVAAQRDTLIPFYQKQINSKNTNKHFLPVSSPSLAAAKLQEQVKGILKRTGGQLLSTQPINTPQEGTLTPIKIRVHMKGSITTLLNTIHSLETAPRLAFIDNLQVQRTGNNRNARQRKNSGNNLDVRFDLKMYMLKKG